MILVYFPSGVNDVVNNRIIRRTVFNVYVCLKTTVGDINRTNLKGVMKDIRGCFFQNLDNLYI